MTDLRHLKGAIAGLLGLAATEEQILLTTAPPERQRAELGSVPGRGTQHRVQGAAGPPARCDPA